MRDREEFKKLGWCSECRGADAEGQYLKWCASEEKLWERLWETGGRMNPAPISLAQLSREVEAQEETRGRVAARVLKEGSAGAGPL